MSWMRLNGPAYWCVFVAAFLAMAVWESLRPKRALGWPAERRWGTHALLWVVSGVIQTAVLRLSPLVVAASTANLPFGILNKPWLPFGVRFVAAFLLLDLTRYATHRAFHSVAFLWPVHEVHHSDPDFDVSTGARFHPLEVVSTQAVYFGVITLLAPPVVAVFTAEVVSVLVNFFAHANVSIPSVVEKLLRRAIITPDLHRIHHSEEICEQSNNFGQILPWWDRLFGTYLAEAAAGENGLITGIKGLQNETSLGLGFMLAEPFRRGTVLSGPELRRSGPQQDQGVS